MTELLSPHVTAPAGAEVDRGRPTRAVQTHVSVLLFVGDHVYKLKKNVTEPFIDLSTRDLRLSACRREVELNSRLAPDVYLGVVELPGPDGEPGEPAVLMNRLPEERRLSALLADRDRPHDLLRQVAEKLARWHEGCRTSPQIASAGSCDAMRERWQSSLGELARFAPRVLATRRLERIEEMAIAFVSGRRPLFEQRSRGGKIKDGHGDVLADDIFCLDDGPRIIDCLEFSDELRFVDVIDDCSTLVMDLERLGRPDLGEAFLYFYLAASGDDAPSSLIHHFVAYRALIRAKVACLRWEQTRDEADIDEARRLAAITARHLSLATVHLVLVGGPPGSGKSTLSVGLAAATGWETVHSDEVRRGLFESASEPAPYGAAGYSPAATEATYDAMLRQAVALLERGRSVVLDATWGRSGYRAKAAAVARMTRSHLVQLRCDASLEEAIERVERRLQGGRDASVATPEVTRRLHRGFESWAGAITIDTEQPARGSLTAALKAVSVEGDDEGCPVI